MRLTFLDFDGVMHQATADRSEYFCRASMLVEAIQDLEGEVNNQHQTEAEQYGS